MTDNNDIIRVCRCGRGYSGYHDRWIRLPGAALVQIKASGNVITATCGNCRTKQEEAQRK